MDEITKNLHSLSWWFSAVVVAIFINIISAILIKKLDKQLSKISERWRANSETYKKYRDEKIALLIGDHHLQTLFAINEVRRWVWALGLFFVGNVFFIFSRFDNLSNPIEWPIAIRSLICTLIGFGFLYYCLRESKRAIDDYLILRTVVKLYEIKNAGSIDDD